MSGFARNINIILEDEISHNDDSKSDAKNKILDPGSNNPGLTNRFTKPSKTSFHRRFSQDHMNAKIDGVRQIPLQRKISLQNNSTINTDR